MHDLWRILLLGTFHWISKSGLGPSMKEELEMYHWHIREAGGRSNLGWSRNCPYSTLQLLVRQELPYYATYVGLRPDKKHTLMSYPSFMKFAKTDDSTCFCHIDLNIPNLLKGHRASQIQGTVIFTTETYKSCTEVIFGMHHELEHCAWAC